MSPDRGDISATPVDRPLTVQEAYDALDAFGKGAGRVPLLLLLHASVPQSFRADLLNLLKANFLATEAGQDLTIDADVLFSTLVQPAAAGYFRLDPEVRRHGLALLDAEYRHQAERRSVQVARLLLAYADAVERDAGQALDAMLAEYLAIQRWVALAFIDPSAAAEAFARAISHGLDPHSAAVSMRLGSVTAAVSIPLTGHRELLAYARGINAIATGDAGAGRRLLDGIGDEEVRVGDVTLRTGTAARPEPATESQQASPTSGPSASDARAQPGNDLVFISYARQDRQVAKDIARALEDQGIAVWIDLEDAPFSGDREQQVRGTIEAIDRCALFLPLISWHSLVVVQMNSRRYQWDYALERLARREEPAPFSICPVAIGDISPQSSGVPVQMRSLQWMSVVGGVTDEFVQRVKARLAEHRSPPPARMFGVPAMPVTMVGRTQELRQLESALTFMVPPPPGIPKPLSAPIVSLVGPDGLGKWTLASHAVHGVANRFPDGVIWFGDDRSRAQLLAYAEAFGIQSMFDVPDGVHGRRFREAFATRRVLFVADERFGSHFIPTVSLAGPTCVVLRLLRTPRGSSESVITMAPLAESDARELLHARAGRTVENAAILAFAAGNPLLLRLLGGAIAFSSESDTGAWVRHYTSGSEAAPPAPKVNWLVEYFWQSSEQEALRALIEIAGNNTQAAIRHLPGGRPTSLERLGLVNIHGDMVRMPAEVAQALREIKNTPLRTAQQQRAPQAENAPPDWSRLSQSFEPIAIPPIQIARDLIAQGDLAKAQGVLEERLRLCEQTGNRSEEAITLGDLATVAVQRDAFERALKLQQVRITVYEELDDQPGIAAALTEIGIIHRRRGAFDDAVPAFERALEIYERLGDRLSAAKLLRVLGTVAGDSERFEDAFRLLERALALFESTGQQEGLIGRAQTFGDLAGLAFGAGQHQRAVGFAQERLTLAGRLNDDRAQLAALEQVGEMTARSGDPQKGASYLEEARALAFALNDIDAEVRILATLGRLRAAVGDVEQALALFQTAWTKTQIHSIALAESYGRLLFALGRRGLGTSVLENARLAYEQVGHTDGLPRIDQLLTSPDTEETRQGLLAHMRAWIQAPPAEMA